MEEKKFLIGEKSFLWIVLVISAVFFGAAIKLYIENPGVGGDAAFPVVASFIMLLGAAISIFETRKWAPAKFSSSSVVEKTKDVLRMLLPNKTSVICLYMVIYALILDLLGFNTATFIFLTVSMITLHPKKPLKSVVIALFLTAAIWVIFGVLFRVRLP